MVITSMHLKSGPSAEPILFTDQTLQRHIRLTDNDASEQAYVELLITAARSKVEEDTGRAIITQTWNFYLDSFPCETISLPKPPLSGDPTISYTNTAGTDVTLTLGTDYQVYYDKTPVVIRPGYGRYWPVTRSQTADAVTISAVCGYGASGDYVPAPIKQAMLMLISHWYENREAVSMGRIPSEVPMAYDALIAPYRIMEYV